MRSFVAIPLPLEIETQLRSAVRSLEQQGVSGRGVSSGAMHLTLKFLGELSRDQVPEVADRLGRVAAGSGPFRVALGGPGAFPNRRSPRVVFVEVESGAELLGLHQSIEEGLVGMGQAREERGYRPHLTLMRLKSRRHGGRLRNWLESPLAMSGASFQVDCFHLYQSVLKPQGAEYRVVETFCLTGE